MSHGPGVPAQTPVRWYAVGVDVDAIRCELAGIGLNAFGVADPARWDASAGPERRAQRLLPGTRAILVFGSGGPALWNALLGELRAHPEHLSAEAHPLDAYVRRAVERADPALAGARRRWFFAAADTELHLDFRVLADLAGLGGRSRMGLLLHPEFGLWLGLRAACFLDQDVPFSAPMEADPCAGCPAPCVTGCPGDAFVDGAWNVDRCAAFHEASRRCASSCDARGACPKGAEHRYGPEEMVYHYDRAAGRPLLRALVGVSAEADGFEGVGPHWNSWRKKVAVASPRGL